MQLLLAVRSLDLIAVGTPAHFSWQFLSFQLSRCFPDKDGMVNDRHLEHNETNEQATEE